MKHIEIVNQLVTVERLDGSIELFTVSEEGRAIKIRLAPLQACIVMAEMAAALAELMRRAKDEDLK